MASEKLQKLRISPKCYHILNEARIKPGYLSEFYSTYKLPADPFFPLFLSVKHQWFQERERIKEEKEAAIFERVKQLPEHRRRALRILAEFEQKHHPGNAHPIWDERLFPKTKKRAEEFHHFNEKDWYKVWKEYLNWLSLRYRGINEEYTEKLLAALILRCRKIERREITENFRKLSREYHPDTGGDAESFLYIAMARDILLSRENRNKLN